MDITDRAGRPALHRNTNNRVVTGLAAGIGDELGVSASYVRAAFVVLAFAGGVGVVAYLIGLAMTMDSAGPGGEPRPSGRSQRIGLGLMLLAVLIALEAFNLWFGNQVVWSVGLMAFGLAAILDQGGNYDRFSTWLQPGTDGRVRLPISRLVVGSVVLFAGIGALVVSVDGLTTLAFPLLAAVTTVIGLMLLVGPWVQRLVAALNEERTERIRSEERSEVAAHLHDSVLQTLALIQRTDEPNKMVTLARAQERDLRQWLFEQDPDVDEAMLSTALQAMASRIEGIYDVRVEVVTVGDVLITGHLDAMVRAAGEAAANAARHSGVQKISVYAESTNEDVQIFVSDQGKGFDPANVDDDRHGITDSVIGRMTRHGGTATVTSESGEGTEIHLSMALGSDR